MTWLVQGLRPLRVIKLYQNSGSGMRGVPCSGGSLSHFALSVEPGEAGQLAQSKALPKNAVSVAMYLGRPKGR